LRWRAYASRWSIGARRRGGVSLGRLAGCSALLAHGGWIVLPLAAVAGGLLAALLRGTEAALDRLSIALAHERPRSRGDGAACAPARPVRGPLRPRLAELACNAAGRAPPPAT
jgi:hypothetical protein